MGIVNLWYLKLSFFDLAALKFWKTIDQRKKDKKQVKSFLFKILFKNTYEVAKSVMATPTFIGPPSFSPVTWLSPPKLAAITS